VSAGLNGEVLMREKVRRGKMPYQPKDVSPVDTFTTLICSELLLRREKTFLITSE
jgi:hypothetical protein